MRYKRQTTAESGRSDYTLGAQRVPHTAAVPTSQPARGMTNIQVRNTASNSTATAVPGSIRELKVR